MSVDRTTTVRTPVPEGLEVRLPAENAPSGTTFVPSTVVETLTQGWPRTGYQVRFIGGVRDSYTGESGSASYGDRGWPLDMIPDDLRPLLKGEAVLAGSYESIVAEEK